MTNHNTGSKPIEEETSQKDMASKGGKTSQSGGNQSKPSKEAQRKGGRDSNSGGNQ